jgi:hypothetical protein
MATKAKPKRITTDKSEANIRKTLRKLRKIVDANMAVNPESARVAQAMETAIRWATEKTVGWMRPEDEVRYLAALIQNDRADISKGV